MRRYGILALVIAAVIFLAFRLFTHSSALMEPAVITPAMNAHHALAPTLDARLYRLTHERQDARRTGRPRLIALTFDDGPYAVTTPLLLDVLNDLRVRATFFIIGRDAELQPELSRRIVSEGYEVANHTYSHPRLDLAPTKRVVEELVHGTKALRAFTNAKTISEEWRPPHGRYTEATITTAQRLGFTTVLWNDDPGDYRRYATPEMLRAHIAAHASAPEILLLHSGVLATIEMLPSIVAEFRAKGYTFVTVSELFAHTPLEELNHPERITLVLSGGKLPASRF
jgi:peptidoglycan/xylan/chitin deacetylase (PgdA/CDA1 family)